MHQFKEKQHSEVCITPLFFKTEMWLTGHYPIIFFKGASFLFKNQNHS